MILRLFVLVSVLLCACSTLAADEAEIARFNEAYAEYQALASAERWQKTIDVIFNKSAIAAVSLCATM
jgi:hypothetical protein